MLVGRALVIRANIYSFAAALCHCRRVAVCVCVCVIVPGAFHGYMCVLYVRKKSCTNKKGERCQHAAWRTSHIFMIPMHNNRQGQSDWWRRRGMFSACNQTCAIFANKNKLTLISCRLRPTNLCLMFLIDIQIGYFCLYLWQETFE